VRIECNIRVLASLRHLTLRMRLVLQLDRLVPNEQNLSAQFRFTTLDGLTAGESN
jgi:hypothetical protein